MAPKKDTTRFRILLSYNGSEYHGWQKQLNQPTVQEEVEQALKNIFKQDISVVGAGRTDAGAHALGQTAHFDLSGGTTSLSNQPASSLKKSQSAVIPPLVSNPRSGGLRPFFTH